MTYQTWTRKPNAKNAAEKKLKSINLSEKIELTGLDIPPADRACTDGRGYMAVLHVVGPEDEVKRLVEDLGSKIKVVAEIVTEAEAEAPAPKKEAAPAKRGPRQEAATGKRFKVVGGDDAANPYRQSTLSHAAFELVKAHPGISYEEFKAKGGRVRTLTEDLRAGRVRTVSN